MDRYVVNIGKYVGNLNQPIDYIPSFKYVEVIIPTSPIVGERSEGVCMTVIRQAYPERRGNKIFHDSSEKKIIFSDAYHQYDYFFNKDGTMPRSDERKQDATRFVLELEKIKEKDRKKKSTSW